MNRRQLMCTGAAALFASIPNARAATYDVLIKGGRVIDPSVGLDAIRDVAIAAGKIVAVEADIAGDHCAATVGPPHPVDICLSGAGGGGRAHPGE
jgi:adenine deaminase